jgi:hypothetical protein
LGRSAREIERLSVVSQSTNPCFGASHRRKLHNLVIYKENFGLERLIPTPEVGVFKRFPNIRDYPYLLKYPLAMAFNPIANGCIFSMVICRTATARRD